MKSSLAVRTTTAVFIALITAVFLASGCRLATAYAAEDVQTGSSALTAQAMYSEKAIPVYRDSTTSGESATVRMYGDIPFMRIDDFYNSFYLTGAVEKYPSEAAQMTVTRSGDVYTASAYDGTASNFDVAADTMTCPDLNAFTANPFYTLRAAHEPEQFVRQARIEYEGQPSEAGVSFGEYGIELIGDGDDLWVPLPTLQALFADMYQHIVFYNGEGIYVWDGIGALQASNAKSDAASYYDFAAQGASKSAERAAFDYANLCFAVDTFYGAPGSRCSMAADITSKGLDAALDVDDNHKELKALLKSTDMRDYIEGLWVLFTLALDDGTHTSFSDTGWDADTASIIGQWMEAWGAKGLTMSVETARLPLSLMAIGMQLKTTLSDEGSYDHLEIWGGAGTLEDFQGLYFDKGDTGMFVISGHIFVDEAAWKSYYADPSAGQLPLDTYGMFLRALDRAEANGVKNFVVDMAMALGGESNVATAMAKVMTGQGYRYEHNTLSKRNERIVYDVDLNHDGAFDERDGAVKYPFRFAVLESAVSYSAANYFPSLMRDAGVMVLGERSGGGSCAPQMTPESDGLHYKLSGRLKLIDENGSEIDGGIEPDVVLVGENEGGGKDYSRFYDLAGMSPLIDAFYLEPGPSLSKAAFSGTAVRAAKGACKLAWGKVAGATAYEVAYRKAGASSWAVKGTTKTALTLKGLAKGAAYQVRVRAVAAQTDTALASEGAWSSARRVYVKSASDVKAAPGKRGSKSVVVTWKKAKGAAGYKVAYSTKKSMAGAKTVTVKGPSKVKRVLKGLKQGKTYYVKVAPYKSVDGKAYIGQQSGAKKARAA